MNRFFNLPHRGEIPPEMADQFFGSSTSGRRSSTKMEQKSKRTPNSSRHSIIEVMEGSGAALFPGPSVEAEHHQQQEPEAEMAAGGGVAPRPSSGGLSSASQLAKGSGPLGWLGLAQLCLGIGLLCVDALSNPLSQCRLCVSASLCAILCALFSCLSASRFYY
jgi:hypothetical protein